jgi:hypothetical protein
MTYTPQQLVDKYTPGLNPQQKAANVAYFKMMLAMIKDGGAYTWPALGKTFTVKSGKFEE